MNSEALNEHADWIDKGDFGERGFNMRGYDECVLGHYAARELKAAGRPATAESIWLQIDGLALRAFGIRQSEQYDDWHFAFGSEWGTDPHAAAYRLRDLARNKKAPPRELWDQYRTAPEPLPSDPSPLISGKLEEALC